MKLSKSVRASIPMYDIFDAFKPAMECSVTTVPSQ